MIRFFILFFSLFFLLSFSQFETQKKKKFSIDLGKRDPIVDEDIKEEEEKKTETKLFEINKPPKTLLEWNKKKPDISLSGIDNEFTKPKYNIKTGLEKKEGVWREEFKKDQNFGEFKTESKTVKIICRDHEYVDGDRVMILLNGQVLVQEMLLTGEYKSIEVELQTGFNKFEFVALNEGTSSPNTAEFRVIDENGNNLVGNIWYITQGANANLIVTREEKKDNKKND